MRATRVAGIGTAMIAAAAGLVVPGMVLSFGIVSSPGMERPFALYDTYLLRVRPGREYPMSPQAAGNGRLVFGAFEYDERGRPLGNNYSQRCALSPKFRQFSFTDAELQGEGTYGSDHTEMLTLGEWRARWLGANQFGVQLSYLPAFGYGLGPNVNRAEQEVIGTPRLLAMSLLHGTPVWAQYVDTPLVYRAWTVLDELDEPGVAFLPLLAVADGQSRGKRQERVRQRLPWLRSQSSPCDRFQDRSSTSV